ncbi:hypothetical protein LQZ18_10960 [Lachnospiraceae bacterium ZAX-1]
MQNFGHLTIITLSDAIITGLIWIGITIVFDIFGWVIVKHPWSLSFREFYVNYQPWISLIYLAIAVSPTVACLIGGMQMIAGDIRRMSEVVGI